MADTNLKKEDAVLDYTQEKREQIIAKMTQNGMPGDPKDLYVILNALDGMDRAALTKKKIQSESELGSKAALAGAAITEILTNLRGNITKERELTNTTPTATQTQAPSSIVAPPIIEGELEGANSNINYDNIASDLESPQT